MNFQCSEDITAAGLAELKGLNELRSLGCLSLDAAGLNTIKDFSNLECLRAGVDAIADLSVLKSVKSLDISVSGTAGDKAGKVRLPPNLRSLELSRKTLVKLDFQSSPHIERVSLSLLPTRRYDEKTDRFYEPVDFAWLKGLSELKELVLREAVDEDMAAVAKFASPRAVTVIGGTCEQVAIGDAGIKAIAQMKHLESLRIVNGWGITDSGIGSLADLPGLRRLELWNFSTKLTADGLAAVWQLKQLRTLAFASFDSEADKGFIARLKGLAELEELTFSGRVTDEELKNLAALKKLRRLDLTHAGGFTDVGVIWLLTALPNLETLKITIRYEPPKEHWEK